MLRLIPKNIRRDPVRSLLTVIGTMVLVLLVTALWSILDFLDRETRDRSRNIKVIVLDRWQLPSQMPYSYAARLCEGAPSAPGDYRIRPEDSMTWQLYGGSTDQGPRTRSNTLMAFALEPRSILTMMDELDELPRRDPEAAAALKAAVERMGQNRQRILVGRERLRRIKKQVGDRITFHSFNYKGIDLEFEIAGVLPPGRYDVSVFMHRDYLNAALDDYERRNGRPHPNAGRSLSVVWLRVPDSAVLNQVGKQIMESPEFRNPAVKVETASSGIGTFLEAYRQIFWGMRFVLVPAICITMAIIIANSISISVRERRPEFAVLKVLGFQPSQILVLVVGEALLLGVGAGILSSGGMWLLVNHVFGGIRFPIAFFGGFLIPNDALWWGPAIGGLAALAGSIVPAWTARNMRVAEVFARVT